MPRTAIRATPVRPSNDPVQKKTRLRKNASQRSMLDIDTELLAKVRQEYGADLQWVTDSVLGQATPQVRMSYEVNAWEPVTPDMFDGIFDGMFMKKGHTGEINFEGLVLMWRPYELTEEAKAEEQAARNNALLAQSNMLKSGQIPGFSAGFEPDHPTALARNVVQRSVRAPMEIPKD